MGNKVWQGRRCSSFFLQCGIQTFVLEIGRIQLRSVFIDAISMGDMLQNFFMMVPDLKIISEISAGVDETRTL